MLGVRRKPNLLLPATEDMERFRQALCFLAAVYRSDAGITNLDLLLCLSLPTLSVMKPKVYIETTIFSYLTARLSTDLIVAGHQKITELWWEERRENFGCFISQIVLNEISRGDAQAAQHRVAKASGSSLLNVNQASENLSVLLVAEGALPAKAAIDALHISIAAIHEIDFLLTWNCTHIANAQTRPKIENIIRAAGFQPPIIATPEEL